MLSWALVPSAADCLREAVGTVRRTPLFRHGVKRLCREAERMINSMDRRLASSVGDDETIFAYDDMSNLLRAETRAERDGLLRAFEEAYDPPAARMALAALVCRIHGACLENAAARLGKMGVRASLAQAVGLCERMGRLAERIGTMLEGKAQQPGLERETDAYMRKIGDAEMYGRIIKPLEKLIGK